MSRDFGTQMSRGSKMAKKVHIICGKCGSDDIIFIINNPCIDNPYEVASIYCKNCSELTGICEWSEANNKELRTE